MLQNLRLCMRAGTSVTPCRYLSLPISLSPSNPLPLAPTLPSLSPSNPRSLAPSLPRTLSPSLPCLSPSLPPTLTLSHPLSMHATSKRTRKQQTNDTRWSKQRGHSSRLLLKTFWPSFRVGAAPGLAQPFLLLPPPELSLRLLFSSSISSSVLYPPLPRGSPRRPRTATRAGSLSDNSLLPSDPNNLLPLPVCSRWVWERWVWVRWVWERWVWERQDMS